MSQLDQLVRQSQLGAVLLHGRRSCTSTELVLELTGVDRPCFWLDLWGEHTRLGYACFERRPVCGRPTPGETTSFVLTELLSASSPAPSPIVSLSGVLWNRRAALEASSEPPFSRLEEEWIVKRRPQSGRGGFPHET